MKFFANLIDQLDFALDHIVLEDVNYKRLSLMLVDNAMELTLHRYAEARSAENRYRDDDPVHDPAAVSAALRRHFEAKVRLAKLCGLLSDDEAVNIETLHGYRNELYHRGLMHEQILPALALFYFRLTCDVLARFQPSGYTYTLGERIPHRAVKYIGSDPFGRGDGVFSAAWARLREVADNIPLRLADDLHAHMAATIEETNRSIDFLVEYDPAKLTRKKVIIESQTWPMAFDEEVKRYAREHGCTEQTMPGYLEWLEKNHPKVVRTDPVNSWNKRLASLKKEKDEHKALRKYSEFMSQTRALREAIDESATQLDMHIEQQIEEARGN